jgi:hypothetical protein
MCITASCGRHDPRNGSKVWEAPDREIGESGKDRSQVVAHRNLQPSAAFHDRENRREAPGRVIFAQNSAAARRCVNFGHSITDRSASVVCEPDSPGYRPHPRHWRVLAEVAGVSAEGQ